ncbi:QueT transporter family protein [bacterium]|nr:QueT transporter family protein [candidate division CSSED10-310 bacterium]
MRDVILMWKETRMVVLTAVTAAIYAATVMPLKVATIIPGFTEIRPGVAFVVFCSFLFGPAAAWGAAFGNLIADFFGTLGLGSIFGFAGNFLFGLIPYKAYRILAGEIRFSGSTRSWFGAISAILLASMTCGFTIGWGVDLLGFVPFHILGSVITINNAILAGIIVPVLLKILYERTRKWGLLYQEILQPEDTAPGLMPMPGLVLTAVGATGGLSLGFLTGFGFLTISVATPVLLLPFIACTVLGTILL